MAYELNEDGWLIVCQILVMTIAGICAAAIAKADAEAGTKHGWDYADTLECSLFIGGSAGLFVTICAMVAIYHWVHL